MPAEAYVEYQLAAQELRPRDFVVVMGYGECAPGYIPTEQAVRERDGNLHDWNWGFAFGGSATFFSEKFGGDRELNEYFAFLELSSDVFGQDWLIWSRATFNKMEGRIFLEELLDTFPVIELTGEPRRQRSNLNNALKSLPVRLGR